MSLINTSASPLDGSGFGLHRAFSTSSDNVALVTPGNSSPIHQSGLPSVGAGSFQNGGGNSNNNSPLNLTTMLNNLTMAGPASQGNTSSSGQGPYLLKLKNVPHDLTLRECYALFALARGVLNVELLSETTDNTVQGQGKAAVQSVVAKFDSLHLVSQYASIFDAKSQIFGPSFPYKCYVEVLDELTQQQVSFHQASHSPQLLSHSPETQSQVNQHTQQQQQPQPHSHQQQQQQQQQSQQQQQQHPSQAQSQQQQQQQQSQNAFQLPGSSSNMISPPQSASSVKRPGLLVQRSRFSFSDPFSNDSPHQHHSQQQQQDATTPLKSHDAGKSFLLMENDEINESIWGSNGGIPSSMSGLAVNSQPQTPSLEWGSSGRRQSSSFFSSVGPTAVPSNDVSSMHLTNQISHQMPTGLQQHTSLPYSLVGHVQPNSAPGADIGLSQAQQPQSAQTQQQIQSITGQSSQQSQASNGPHKSSGHRSSTSKGSQSNLATSQKNSSSASISSGTGISQVDLSLLARVPPPANPADQNPPCNTLYVGNLPPDATEHELRQLFSGQKGFRRLSFRNKNTNGNGHGPMCFVEFEDVAHATRALAELYGRQLPRSSGAHNNKGGIRLSFSKNPLGVRGPNSRRGGNSSGASSGNYSYAAAFGKSS